MERGAVKVSAAPRPKGGRAESIMKPYSEPRREAKAFSKAKVRLKTQSSLVYAKLSALSLSFYD
jgi:hypothetical protein